MGLESWVLGLGSGTVDTGRVPFGLFWFSFCEGHGSWDLGQGLLILAESLLIYFGLIFVRGRGLEPFVYQANTL